MHDMLPNVALEKHAIVGAGLTWKRIYGSSTGIRPEQKQPGDIPETTPWKAPPSYSSVGFVCSSDVPQGV